MRRRSRSLARGRRLVRRSGWSKEQRARTLSRARPWRRSLKCEFQPVDGRLGASRRHMIMVEHGHSIRRRPECTRTSTVANGAGCFSGTRRPDATSEIAVIELFPKTDTPDPRAQCERVYIASCGRPPPAAEAVLIVDKADAEGVGLMSGERPRRNIDFDGHVGSLAEEDKDTHTVIERRLRTAFSRPGRVPLISTGHGARGETVS